MARPAARLLHRRAGGLTRHRRPQPRRGRSRPGARVGQPRRLYQLVAQRGRPCPDHPLLSADRRQGRGVLLVQARLQTVGKGGRSAAGQTRLRPGPADPAEPVCDLARAGRPRGFAADETRWRSRDPRRLRNGAQGSRTQPGVHPQSRWSTDLGVVRRSPYDPHVAGGVAARIPERGRRSRRRTSEALAALHDAALLRFERG